MTKTGSIESRILTALRRYAPSTEPIGRSRWSFALANGKPLSVSVGLAEQWLTIETPLGDRALHRDPWKLARMNATLDGLSKFVLMPGNGSVHLRADLPLFEEHDSESDYDNELAGDFAEKVYRACTSVNGAFRKVVAESQRDATEVAAPKAQQEICSTEIDRLVGDLDWGFKKRDEGKFVIDLDVRDGFHQAIVETRGEGIYLSTEITQAERLNEPSRQALGVLLLKTGGLVRMARPAVEEDERLSVRFEVHFGTKPGTAELKHALSSLSIACGLCGREASVIGDEIIARKYLAAFGAESGVEKAQQRSSTSVSLS